MCAGEIERRLDASGNPRLPFGVAGASPADHVFQFRKLDEKSAPEARTRAAALGPGASSWRPLPPPAPRFATDYSFPCQGLGSPAFASEIDRRIPPPKRLHKREHKWTIESSSNASTPDRNPRSIPIQTACLCGITGSIDH
jgi:hypothetical protein